MITSLQSSIIVGDHASQRKASEANAANHIILCNILKFLEPSPGTLFENVPTDDPDAFIEDIFKGLVTCLVSPNDEIRALSGEVAKRLFLEDGILMSLRKSDKVDFKSLRLNFWKMT
jgi:hypothetical protein